MCRVYGSIEMITHRISSFNIIFLLKLVLAVKICEIHEFVQAMQLLRHVELSLIHISSILLMNNRLCCQVSCSILEIKYILYRPEPTFAQNREIFSNKYQYVTIIS